MSISIYNQGDGLGFVAFQANQVCVTSNSFCTLFRPVICSLIMLYPYATTCQCCIHPMRSSKFLQPTFGMAFFPWMRLYNYRNMFSFCSFVEPSASRSSFYWLQAGKPLVNLGYLPSYSVLKRAMLSYGYLFDTPGTKASASGSTAAGWFHTSFFFLP